MSVTSFPRPTQTQPVWERATRFFNPVIVGILRSPFHGLLSGRLLVITVRGRKTGALYQIPVAYRQELAEILIFTPERRRWWRNLAGGADVTVRLRGLDIHAVGEAIVDRAIVIRTTQAAGKTTAARAAQRANGKVLLRLHLAAQTPQAF